MAGVSQKSSSLGKSAPRHDLGAQIKVLEEFLSRSIQDPNLSVPATNLGSAGRDFKKGWTHLVVKGLSITDLVHPSIGVRDEGQNPLLLLARLLLL